MKLINVLESNKTVTLGSIFATKEKSFTSLLDKSYLFSLL